MWVDISVHVSVWKIGVRCVTYLAFFNMMMNNLLASVEALLEIYPFRWLVCYRLL